MRTTANATAASPPATPNQAVFGSIYLPLSERRPKKPRTHTLKEVAGSPSEVEAVQAAGRARPLDVDAFDVRHARAAFDRAPELFQLVPGALRDELDRAVAVVPYPAGQPELRRGPLHEVAKPHALDVTVNDSMQTLHCLYARPM